ncbi:MAG: DUF3800 domain-containing protein [Chloroflexi bacterium]|nr:DUF3800 domain-containing protein [Chloroflexota bacterium]
MRHLFCYVDETGQDTRGVLFIVAVVIAEDDVEAVRQACERIERATGKRAKWIKTRYARRLEYARQVLAESAFRGRLYAATHLNQRDYLRLTLQTIAEALKDTGGGKYEATIRIDGLPRTQERLATLELRRMGVAGGRVKGVRRDENDALIRLADAICGLCRAAREDQPEMKALWERAVKAGVVRELEK